MCYYCLNQYIAGATRRPPSLRAENVATRPNQERMDTMRMLKLIILGSLLAMAATGAMAQTVLPSPNALGLYFDSEATANDLTLGSPTAVDVYLILTNPTVAFISAWEAKVTIATGGAITNLVLPIGSTAVATGPDDFAAAMSEPMPGNALTKLAVFTVAATAEQNTFLYLAAVDNPSVASDLPALQLTDGSWHAVPVSSGDVGTPVATINSSTPNESSSWGTVKSLFR